MVAIDPIADVLKAAELFTEVAVTHPLSAALLALGSLFVAVSVAVFGGLSLGGVFSAIGRYAGAGSQRE